MSELDVLEYKDHNEQRKNVRDLKVRATTGHAPHVHVV